MNNKSTQKARCAWPQVHDDRLVFPEVLEQRFPSIIMRLETLDAYAVENGLARGESIDLLRVFLVIDQPTEECLSRRIENAEKASAFFMALKRLFADDHVKEK